MNMNLAASALPEAVLLPLAIWFFAGAGFYFYRILFAEHVRSVYGYFDLEVEIGHGLCALAMVTMISPMLLPVPFLLWTVILGTGFVWFVVRAITWGRRVSYATRWWWDWAHVGMLGGMALSFAGIGAVWLTWPLAGFWAWLAAYYTYELFHDAKTGNKLYIGSDLVHASMGAAMFAMTMVPSLFMGDMPM